MNIYSLKKFNVINTPIDLSIIETNCAVGGTCTMETEQGTYIPLIKSAIDDWFTSVSISSDVTVEIHDNVLYITDLPENFILSDVEYGIDTPYLISPFGFGGTDSDIFYNEEDKAIYIKPEFFNNLTAFNDGIYKFTLKFKKDNGEYIEIQNCAFIDISIKCKVASVLQNILKEAIKTNTEPVSKILHILHYALINGSNCACNCDELCNIYKGLIELIDTLDPSLINSDCGC